MIEQRWCIVRVNDSPREDWGYSQRGAYDAIGRKLRDSLDDSDRVWYAWVTVYVDDEDEGAEAVVRALENVEPLHWQRYRRRK